MYFASKEKFIFNRNYIILRPLELSFQALPNEYRRCACVRASVCLMLTKAGELYKFYSTRNLLIYKYN